MVQIIIIGGGIGGCSAAIEFANAGHKVLLIEKKKTLLSGSSDDTPCRLGLGFHYIDIETAKMHLRATIDVLKKYSNFIVAADKPITHPYRRGRYFVVNNSQFEIDQIYKLHKALRHEYEKLIKEDKSNEILGPPSLLSRILNVSEYKDIINTDIVIAGFETAEQTLNWPKFKEYLTDRIEQNPNISVYKNTVVNKVRPDGLGGFIIHAENNSLSPLEQSSLIFKSNYVINASWERIEEINATVGFAIKHDEIRTNRTKVLAQVQLPASLENINSMLFCFGPHCSLTNVGNGRGYISYEPVTNIESTTDLKISDFSKRLLDDHASMEEKIQYAKKILEGVTSYIPAMRDAKVIDARFGNVRTLGKVDIYSSESEFHKRHDLGIKAQQIGWIDFPCMKLLYFHAGALEVKKMLEMHIQADEVIKLVANQATSQGYNEAVTKSMASYLRRCVSTDELLRTYTEIGNSFDKKLPKKSINDLIIEYADAAEGLI